mgnify:CR=1 FL=1
MNFKTIELISFGIVILVIFGLFLLCYIGYTDNKNKEQKIRKIVVPKISQIGPKAVLINLTLILVIARVIHKL